PHLLAVHRPVRGQDVGAEPRRDGLRGFGAGRRHAVRKLVGIEARHAAAAELVEDVALASGNAASEGDSDHDVSPAKAGHYFSSLAAGPHPRRELTLMPRLGFPCPRLGMAAGAPFFTGVGAPRPPRTDADASPRIPMSSPRHGRRRSLLYWRRGPTPAANRR